MQYSVLRFQLLMTLLLESCQFSPEGSIFFQYLINISKSIIQRSGSTLHVQIHPFYKSQIAVMMAALLLKGRFAFHLAGTLILVGDQLETLYLKRKSET